MFFWHDGDSLGVDGAQVGIFEQSSQISFAGFLQGHNSDGFHEEPLYRGDNDVVS
jgi:hypothetical protein